MREVIRTFWRLGYLKLLDWPDYTDAERHVTIDDGEWKQLFWRFYWREKQPPIIEALKDHQERKDDD